MTIEKLIELAGDLADRTLYHYTATGERWDNSHSDDQSKIVAKELLAQIEGKSKVEGAGGHTCPYCDGTGTFLPAVEK